jgi:hypothetical protein
MMTISELPEERVGCQGVICPLASELKVLEQHVLQMEQRVKDHNCRMSRMALLFRLMADSLEGMAPPLAASGLKKGKESVLRTCIALLMEARDDKGHYLFHGKNHWQAVYRIIVDRQLGVADGDYAGFDSLVWQIEPPKCRIPFSPSALRQISKTNFTRPFERWCYDPAYFKTRKPFDQMFGIASRFNELLEENGLGPLVPQRKIP